MRSQQREGFTRQTEGVLLRVSSQGKAKQGKSKKSNPKEVAFVSMEHNVVCPEEVDRTVGKLDLPGAHWTLALLGW